MSDIDDLLIRDYDEDEPEECPVCNGDGYIHDCGEDTCCCANPEVDEMVECDECGGGGVVR